MNKLVLEVFLKGVKDDSFGEGADRKLRYVAQFYAPGHTDLEVVVSAEAYTAMLSYPPMVTRWLLPLTLASRSDIARSSRTGRDYVRDSVSVAWGTPEYVGSLLDEVSTKKAG